MIIGNHNPFQKQNHWNPIKQENNQTTPKQNHYTDILNTNDTIDQALNILNERYQNKLISHEEYRKKSQELLRKKNKPLT